CFNDADCRFGGPCVCEGAELGIGNTCTSGNCRTDADCGPPGFCSPSSSCSGGASGYYCHTLEDACIEDADCNQGFQSGRCGYVPDARRWECGVDSCLGTLP
ncbi:MAG TPA: hypothetical protein VMG12_18565, partial [Polyangiaceae bacterium]|nr:hypothetical protein [Polyangiaceae bacterium]